MRMDSASSSLLDRAATVAFTGAFLAVGVVYMAVFVVPPLITVFVDDLGLSYSQAGALMSVYLVGYALTSLVCGQLADRFGAVQVMTIGLALASASTFLFAATDDFAVFLVSRVGVGVATGLVYATGITFVASLLPQRRLSTGVGVYLAGLSAGVTVAFLVTPLLEDAYGWRAPFVAIGITILIGTIAFFAMANPVSARTSPPATAGLDETVSTRQLVADPAFLRVCATLFVAMFVAYGVYTWIPPYLDESAGFSVGQISAALAISFAVGMPATIIAGWASDRTGRPMLIAGIGFAMALTLIVLAAADQISFGLATMITIIASFGVTGGLIPLFALPAMITAPANAAKAMGMATSAAIAGAIASTFLGGWMVEKTDGYAVPFVVYAAATAVAVIVFFPAAATAVRRGRGVAAA